MIGAKLLLLAFLVFMADAHFRRPPLRPFTPRPLPEITSIGNVLEDDSNPLIAPTEPMTPIFELPSVEDEYGTKYPVTTPQIRPQVPTRPQLPPRPRWPLPTILTPPNSEENTEDNSEATPKPELIIVYPENTNPPTRHPIPGSKSVFPDLNPKPDPILDSQSEEVPEADPGLSSQVDPELIYKQEEIVKPKPEQVPLPELNPEPETKPDVTSESGAESEPEPLPGQITTFVIPGDMNIYFEEDTTSSPPLDEILEPVIDPIPIPEPPEPLPTPDTSSLLPESTEVTTLYPTPPATEEYYPFKPDFPPSIVAPVPPPLQASQNIPATTPSPTYYPYYPIGSTTILDYKCLKGNDYYPISKECDTYIECKKFVARKHFCPDGLVFNPEVNWPDYPCAYPTQVSCYNKTIIQKPNPTNECPRQFGFFQYKQGDCTKYIVCQNGRSNLMTCPNGLAFNPKNNACEWPENVPYCNIKLKPTPSKNCPQRYGTFPDRNGDCSKYFVCQDGRADLMTCPKGLAFNSKIGGCDWPENVPSCNPNVFQGFTCPAPPMDMYGRTSELIFKYRYKNSCKYYIACLNGEPRLLQCDVGLSFDESLGFCVESVLVTNCKEY